MKAQRNPASVDSQDDGKCASQVVTEIIFFICKVSVDLLSNLGADATPHQHFLTLCKNRSVSPKLRFFFFIQTCFTARLQPLFSQRHIDFLLWKPAVSSLKYCL